MNEPRPLYSRVFKLKAPVAKFFCPLCRTQRELNYGSKLRGRHYLGIVSASIFLMWLTHELMKERIFFWPFIVWALAEMFHKVFFRMEIPCPHCGFDATWYKKDVKVSKKLVEEFWKTESPGAATPKINPETKL